MSYLDDLKPIKPYHELTEQEYLENIQDKMTYLEAGRLYPQPDWCNCENAVSLVGCYKLMRLQVRNYADCKGCPDRKKMAVTK